MTPDSFYVPEGGAWRATEATRGPWSALHQHGGPPAGLLARAVEASFDRAALRIARINVQLARPLPIDDTFRVAVETVREGKKVRVLRATMDDHTGRDVAFAEALLVRRADVGAAATFGPAPRAPDACPEHHFTFFTAPVGYHTAMEARHVSGTWGTGSLAVWMRMRVPLVPGEEPSPLVRVLVAADSGNGVSVALPLEEYTFVNADLTVALARELDGEYVLLDATTRLAADGIGLADTMLLDAKGPIARCVQSLLVERRGRGTGDR